MSGGQPPTARQYTEHSHCPVCEEFRSDLAKSDAALAAAAEQLRAVMEANEILRKQLSDQSNEIGMLNAEAEMWQERAEMAEAQLKKEADRE